MNARSAFEDTLDLVEEQGRDASRAGLTEKDNPHDCEEFATRWARGLRSGAPLNPEQTPSNSGAAPLPPERRPSYLFFD